MTIKPETPQEWVSFLRVEIASGADDDYLCDCVRLIQAQGALFQTAKITGQSEELARLLKSTTTSKES